MNIPEILPCPNPECKAECGDFYFIPEHPDDSEDGKHPVNDPVIQVQCSKCQYSGPMIKIIGHDTLTAKQEAIRLHNAICRQPTPEAADIETPVAEYHADLEGLRGIALGLRETARHHQMTQEDWINYSLHTADDINEFLRGLYYVPELTEKLYRALKAMPFPPHMPEAAGRQHDEAISAYECAFPILAWISHPPKPEPTEARELNLKWGRHDGRGEYHIEWHAPCGCAYHPEPKPHVHPCIKHSPIEEAPKPPAEWMERCAEEIVADIEYAIQIAFDNPRLRLIGSQEVDKYKAIIARHYSAGDKHENA